MLHAHHLTHYYAATPALLDATFAISPGEVLAYLGPNGSGKSTTVRVLAGLVAPTRGVVTLDGSDIQDDLIGYKAQLGYVPEEAHLYPLLTADEYLRLHGEIRGIPSSSLTRRLDSFIEILGLELHRHSPLGSASKGMRQKVLLTAALLHDPYVIILDEPGSGLDVQSLLVLRHVITGLAGLGRIVFYSSHEFTAVEEVSSRVLVLRDGRLVAEGSPADLRDMTREASLEAAFARLAVTDDVPQMASDLLSAMRL